jgi:phage terminase large subunit
VEGILASDEQQTRTLQEDFNSKIQKTWLDIVVIRASINKWTQSLHEELSSDIQVMKTPCDRDST